MADTTGAGHQASEGGRSTPGSGGVVSAGLGSATADYVPGNHPQREGNQEPDDENVVQVTYDGDEVWNEVEWKNGVADRKAQQQLGEPRCSPVTQHESIHPKLALERESRRLELAAQVFGHASDGVRSLATATS